jgi:probable H4MPT-linked C1 transfer pathway protein
MSPETFVGWDLGGAHIKAVRLVAPGRAAAVVQLPCPLWQGLDRLEEGVDRVLSRLREAPARHALTMTGELADLFDDRASGVAAILGVMRRRLPDDSLRVYAGPGGLLDPESALRSTEQVASANWMASAELAAGRVASGLLVDVGSTTTDLVPFGGGRIAARGHGDRRRLELQELVYTGVVRTPLMSLARRAPFGGDWVPLMAEHFATSADLYRLTGDLPAHADLLETADGRDKSIASSARRLARMVGMDADAADLAAWRGLAAHLAERQLRLVLDACDRVLSRRDMPDDAPIIGAGAGGFLARRLASRLDRPYVPFDGFFEPLDTAGAGIGDCAPAAAVASLAAEESLA